MFSLGLRRTCDQCNQLILVGSDTGTGPRRQTTCREWHRSLLRFLVAVLDSEFVARTMEYHIFIPVAIDVRTAAGISSPQRGGGSLVCHAWRMHCEHEKDSLVLVLDRLST